ncbi:MAG: hypothetical protein SGCHY_002389 [Lobulomycetales sp.]
MYADEADFGAEVNASMDSMSGYVPSYNVAPTRQQPILVHSASGLQLEMMTWGMRFSFTKTLLINARDDKLKKGSGSCWTALKKRNRCVVLASGFFEWKRQGAHKIPHFVSRKDGKLLLMAGLYKRDDSGKGNRYVIVTTNSSHELSWLHDRMPVIFKSKSDALIWIDGKDWDSSVHEELLKPLENGLAHWKVGGSVSRVGNDSSDCIVKVSESSDSKAVASPRTPGKRSGKITDFFKPVASPPCSGTLKRAVSAEDEKEDVKKELCERPVKSARSSVSS